MFIILRLLCLMFIILCLLCLMFIVPRVYHFMFIVRASTQCFCHCLFSTQSFRRALTAAVDSCAEIKCTCPSSSGRVCRNVPQSEASIYTPSIAFRHLPPDSARIGYATEGALFISAQLSTDAVGTPRKVWVLIRLWKQPGAQART